MAQIDVGLLINTYLVPFGLKVVMAIAIWIIGGMLIGTVIRLSRAGMTRRNVDPTLINYSDAALRVGLRIALVMAILEVCSIQTTSFAALIAAAGVAIGVAWSGLLANFAAGIFLVVLHPFKVGDTIRAGGETGTVVDIGLFVTTLTTDNNLRVYVGNNKIFTDNLINYSANPQRRVDLRCPIAPGIHPAEAAAILKSRVAMVPNVLPLPEPVVGIIEFGLGGSVLAVRPYCHPNHYDQVCFDVNQAIAEACEVGAWRTSSSAPPLPGPAAAATTVF
ncbi:MAG: mechanosensitive ion channel family protein [Herminiimonas sp.]|nr:mechanosensitive ion channel family protein [Herminiimonas sp.]